MSNIIINANRQIELKEIYSLIEIYREADRPDIGKILRLIDEDKLNLSEGEIRNIKRYFYQLGLLSSNGHITSEGEKLIDTGKMFVAERGIYKLYVIDDPVVGNMVVGYKPISAYDHEENLEELGTLENLDNFEGYEDREFKNNLDDKGKSRIKFIRNGDESPKVAFGEITMHSLSLDNNTDRTFKWRLKIDIEKKNIQFNGEIEANVSENMKNWFRGFDENYKG
ncbi:MAG: hypothetical protein J7L08_02305, partial [Candidatus Aenigmarchaeota archaeon]|nr:hypothetical protein [Candidatus Aenigmarchaeota archaeon]